MFKKGSYNVKKASEKDKPKEKKKEQETKKNEQEKKKKMELKKKQEIRNVNEQESPEYRKKSHPKTLPQTKDGLKTRHLKQNSLNLPSFDLNSIKIMSSNLKEQIKDQIDGQNEQNNELIIERESQKFMEIFDRVFSENESLDSEDGIVEDILIAIVKKVKTLIKQKFVNEVLLNENGEDESSSETET